MIVWNICTNSSDGSYSPRLASLAGIDVLPERLDVYQHVADGGNFDNQAILDRMADLMRLDDADRRVHFNVDVYEVFQPRLACPQFFHAAHSGHGQGQRANAGQELGVRLAIQQFLQAAPE